MFYDGSFFKYAQTYFYHNRKVGWLSFQPFHGFLEDFIGTMEQGFASYRVVYAAWHQGIFPAKGATEEQLRSIATSITTCSTPGLSQSTCPCRKVRGRRGRMWLWQ